MTQPDNPFTAPGGPTPPVPGNLPVAAPVDPAAPPVPAYAHGVPPYGQPPLRSAAGLGVAAIVLACAWTVVQVLRLAFAPQAAEALRAASDAGQGALASAFTGYDAIGLLYVPLQLAAFVVTCLWLYASRTTAEAADPSFVHARGRVWVWLGWVVPVVSFWFPYQVVRDTRRATATRILGGVGGWWAAWLVFLTVSNAVGRMNLRTTPEAAAIAADGLVPLEVVATVAMIVALVLWIRIVRDITRAQAERIAATSATSY
ncbi:DUF4328 domain-containing protein [Promicromonospora sp. NPDC050880]|uniref:DUF4328 domain-containing protein n=1 Tax=Promicromonospora sp. NPDC050880 TaxID=3364406 RepID=UPI00378986BF